MTKKISDIHAPAVSGKRIAAALLGMALICMSLPASAQFATGGTGQHRGRIFWVNWGSNGENVYGGRTITRGFNVDTPASAANRLDVTCTLGGASSPVGGNNLFVYTPGGWQGDGLDELYNIGGNQPGTGVNPNTLAVGLRTGDANRVEFNFTCSATLGGQPFALSGLVFADAEASGGSEYVAARLTNGGTVRVIDQIAQCRTAANQVRTQITLATVGGFPEVRFGAATPNSCENNATPSLRAGPALIGFIDGATSARVIANGGGISAVAVGAVLELEFSEAIPASYGNAAHVRNAVWDGGEVNATTDFNNPANLATVQQGVRLGATVQADADANGAIGGPDVDALPKTTGPAGGGYANVPLPNAFPGGSYTISNVACVGPAFIAGWIDFNGNGLFDAGERSTQASCPSGSGSVSLAWTIPANYVPQATSYLRLRLSPNATSVANPSGVVVNGEAEDYRLVLPKLTPQVRVAKVSQGGTGGFAFSTTNLVGMANVTLNTTVAGTPVQSATADRNQSNTPVTITETVPQGWTLTAASCSDLNAAQTSNPASFGTLGGAVLTIDNNNLRARSDIVCTFSNRRLQSDLSITKTNSVGQVVAGGSTTYTVRVTNNGSDAATGAVLSDPAAAGLVKTAVACSPSPGQCTAGTTPSVAQLEAGHVLPTLASGQFYEITVTASVSATGQ